MSKLPPNAELFSPGLMHLELESPTTPPPVSPRKFGPAAFLAALEDDAPARARQILDRVWRGRGCLTQSEAEWIDHQVPGDAWPAAKCQIIAARDGDPVPKIPAKFLA